MTIKEAVAIALAAVAPCLAADLNLMPWPARVAAGAAARRDF